MTWTPTLVEITQTFGDSDTLLLDVTGELAFGEIVTSYGTEFTIDITRENEAGGLPFRLTIEAKNPATDRLAIKTIETVPPATIPLTATWHTLEDSPLTPEAIVDLKAFVGMNPSAGSGQKIYTWDIKLANKRLDIVAALVTALADMTTANGYNYNYGFSHRKVIEWGDVPAGGYPFICWRPSDVSFETGMGGARRGRMRVEVFGYYHRKAGDSADETSRIQKDIERAMANAAYGTGTQHLSNAGVELIDYVGASSDPYLADEYEQGRVSVEFDLIWKESGAEILQA